MTRRRPAPFARLAVACALGLAASSGAALDAAPAEDRPAAAPAQPEAAAPVPPVVALYRPEFRTVAVLLDALKRLEVTEVRLEAFGPWLDELQPDGKVLRVPSRLLLEGPRVQVEELAQALPRLDRPAPAVAVTVTVAEVRRRRARETGGFLSFDRDAVPGSADTLFRGTQGTFEPESWLRSRLTGVVPFQGTSLSLGSFEAGGQVFEHVLRALAQRHDAEVLAHSTLVTGQGAPAELRSLVRIPALMLTSVTNPLGPDPQVTMEVRPVDAGLVLTLSCGQVGPDGALLDLNVVFSSAEPNPEPDAVPTDLVLRSRTLKTRLTARDGESVVLGGLTLTRNLGDRRSMPLIDQVPALDALVSARGDTRETTDLVFVLTPRLIVPPEMGVPMLFGARSLEGPAGAAGAVGALPPAPPGPRAPPRRASRLADVR